MRLPCLPGQCAVQGVAAHPSAGDVPSAVPCVRKVDGRSVYRHDLELVIAGQSLH